MLLAFSVERLLSPDVNLRTKSTAKRTTRTRSKGTWTTRLKDKENECETVGEDVTEDGGEIDVEI